MKYIFALCLCSPLLVAAQPTLQENWTFNTNSPILSEIIQDQSYLYLGNTAGDFYCLIENTGKPHWTYKTEGKIQSSALVVGNNVFFESGTVYYMLNKQSGELVWKNNAGGKAEEYNNNGQVVTYALDPWDDKHSNPILYKDKIIVGTGDGRVVMLNSETGEVINELFSIEGAAIRATPTVNDDVLYFGDWNGYVYAYDLQLSSLKWTKKTFVKRPYPSFGGVASDFIIRGNNLYFGMRNPMFHVLNKETGDVVWTYFDSDGGWIIGDPLIYNDTLYVGGSDNHSMLAFNPDTGRPLWKQTRERNIYGRALIRDKYIMYTSVDAYNATNDGELVILDRKTGVFVHKMTIPSGAFASPVLLQANRIVFGSLEGKVYSLSLKLQ